MDKKYIELFKELTRASAVLAEQVMEMDDTQHDDKGFEAAKIMRDDYEALHDRLDENYELTKNDATRLLVCIMLQVQQLQNRIKMLRKAATGYQTDLIPKLQDIVDNAEDDEAAAKMAKEKFIIDDNK